MGKKLLALLLALALAVPSTLMSLEAQAADSSLIYKEYLTEETRFDGTAGTRISIPAEDLALAKTLKSASISVEFKTTSTELQALAAVNGSNHTNDYISLYVSGGTRLGFEVRNSSTSLNYHKYADLSVNVADGKWHTVTFIVSENESYKLYLDGTKLVEAAESTTYFAGSTGWWNATSLTFGGANRISGNSYLYNGSLKNAKLYASAISESQVMQDHANTIPDDTPEYGEDVYKTEEYGIFDMGDYGSYNYRIPALVTTKNGVVLAAADQRHDHWSDWGNIDTVLRRSTDNGLSWEEPMTIIDLKSQPYDTGTQSAFLIDPVMIATESGRVWMLVDMFPESTGFNSIAKTGTGYVEVDGISYLALYDGDGNQYTLRGTDVYDANGNKTNYTVDNGSAENAFNNKGDLYDGEEYVGNIYLSSTGTGNISAPLKPLKTIYLWLTYSDDDGKTWSNPVDISPQVKEEWMKFCGTGPGFGIELTSEEYEGRLVFPIYYTNNGGFQSSACVYSDDGGQTWTRGESPNDGRINNSGVATNSQNPSGISQLTESQIIELQSGNLLQFMRNTGGNGRVVVSRSTDGGATWSDPIDTSAPDVYCQLSVLHMDNKGSNGKDRVLMSNSGGSGRNNGKLRIGEITETATSFSVEWVEEKLFRPGNYAYSCLTRMADNNFGLLYEHNNTIKFTAFNEAFILDEVNLVSPVISNVGYNIEKSGEYSGTLPGDTYVFTVTVDQEVEVEGEPQFRFTLDGELKYADFVSIDETNRVLTFEYVIQEGDEGAIAYRGPKIVSDETNSVRNQYGYSVSAGDTEVSLGSIGVDYSSDVRDIPLSVLRVTAGNSQSGEGPERVFDGNRDTLWHTNWDGCDLSAQYIQFELSEEYLVDGLRYQPRSNAGNGTITQYQILTSDDGVNFTVVAEGTWQRNISWKFAPIESTNAKYIRLQTVNAYSDSGKSFTSAAEIRLTGEVAPEVVPVDKTVLVAAIAEAEEFVADDYTEDSWATFAAALDAAKAVNTDAEATEADVAKAVADLAAAQGALEEKYVEPVNPFEDVFEADYYYDPVMWAVEEGITDGWTPTLFAPEMGCTRGQVVTFLWRAVGEPEAENAENPFTDVAEDAYYYDAVLWAVEEGITDGWTATTFAPDMTCTRGQIVTFIWRAANEPAVITENPFTDVAENAYYYDAVLWAVERHITDGWMPTEFAPEMDCTRGQIVTFLYRYYSPISNG